MLLGHLVLSERSTGLYGKPVVTLTPRLKDAVLPANNFSAGILLYWLLVGCFEMYMLISG